MTIEQLHIRLASAAGTDRLKLLIATARLLAGRDRLHARTVAEEACALARRLEYEGRDAETVAGAHAAALFILAYCEKHRDCGKRQQEAYRLLSMVPAAGQAKILLWMGQLYQQAEEFGHAAYVFRQAVDLLGGRRPSLLPYPPDQHRH